LRIAVQQWYQPVRSAMRAILYEVWSGSTNMPSNSGQPGRKASGAERRIDRLEQVFKREGFRTLSVSDMANRLKCSKRSLYELASSKQELIELVVNRCFARIRQAGWDAAAKKSNAPERMWAFLEVGVDGLNDLGQKLIRDIEADPQGSQIWSEHQRRRAEGIRALVEEGVREGYFQGYHAQLVAEVIMISFRRMRDPSFINDVGISISDAWAELTRLIQYGLLPRDGDQAKAERS
jgi:AcrR family transcriptional regulator